MTPEFQTAIRQLGTEVFDCVVASPETAAWERAFLDVRYADDGSYWDEKLRITVPGRDVISLPPSVEVSGVLYTLKRMRTALGREWFSLKLDITQAGKVTITYGYEPGATEDPMFFES